MALSSSVAIIFLSLTAIPITYLVNTAHTLHGEVGLLASGVVCLTVLCLLVYLVIRREGAPRDPLYYVLMTCTFGGVASLIIALEGDGVVTGFMSEYLTQGEPYLKTAYGIMVSYWDGIGHYSMLVMVLAALGTKRSYREVGLYWAGSIGHSMIVFIPGNIVGKFGLRPSFLLNVPYMIFPFWAIARFMRERPSDTPAKHTVTHTSIVRRPLDFLLCLGLVAAMAVAFLRGFAALEAPNTVFQTYLKDYEPYLQDSVAYPKIQMLVYMFQYVPFYVCAAYGLVYPGLSSIPDWALVHAGAAAQAQVSHIGGSLHYRTAPELRVPDKADIRLVFWVINVALLLVLPQILALRCNLSKAHFTPQPQTASSDSQHKSPDRKASAKSAKTKKTN